MGHLGHSWDIYRTYFGHLLDKGDKVPKQVFKCKRGATGANLNRPALNEMLSDVEENGMDSRFRGNDIDNEKEKSNHF